MKKITAVILAAAMAAPAMAMTDEQMIKEEEQHTAKLEAIYNQLSDKQKYAHVIGGKIFVCTMIGNKQQKKLASNIYKIISKDLNQDLIVELGTNITMHPEMLPEPLNENSCLKTINQILEAV